MWYHKMNDSDFIFAPFEIVFFYLEFELSFTRVVEKMAWVWYNITF